MLGKIENLAALRRVGVLDFLIKSIEGLEGKRDYKKDRKMMTMHCKLE